MNKINLQEKKWKSKFGKEYTLRNFSNIKEEDGACFKKYGITRTKLNKEFLGSLNRSIKILEVGTNIGTQLVFLQKMGFRHLYGIEINRGAIELSKSFAKNIDIIQGSAQDIPFKDSYFDLVFTSGVLIHIAPADIKKTMKEIYRVTRNYVWGFEYYSQNYTEVLYRGRKNMLWKADFPKLYLNLFKDLKLLKERKIKYLNPVRGSKGREKKQSKQTSNGVNSKNVDVMFLLKKNGKEKT